MDCKPEPRAEANISWKCGWWKTQASLTIAAESQLIFSPPGLWQILLLPKSVSVNVSKLALSYAFVWQAHTFFFSPTERGHAVSNRLLRRFCQNMDEGRWEYLNLFSALRKPCRIIVNFCTDVVFLDVFVFSFAYPLLQPVCSMLDALVYLWTMLPPRGRFAYCHWFVWPAVCFLSGVDTFCVI